jgi:hypothetical protein
MTLGKPFMNFRNDLDKCLTYLELLFKLPNFRILFFRLRNLLLHFNKLFGKKVPKLLETYGNLEDKKNYNHVWNLIAQINRYFLKFYIDYFHILDLIYTLLWLEFVVSK